MAKDELDIEYLWRDRRRILGMPITFTKYLMSDDRIFLEQGLLSTDLEEVLLYRVRDISLRISLGQRIFGVGTITLKSSDKTMPILVLKNIKDPRRVKELIHRQVEKMKAERRMRVGEILDDGDNDEDDYMDGEMGS
ncbi:PH domain-containing protein [Neobittarella massiliensis]|uniref:PH domain-containing protein n=1 Tax=Neobittarella massiliensis (ex Bilen et al. 2018) TaxID=2041842 RepID=A0A8J6IF30_9FIRM|nr:PH domain-containing protein [Neobittarella massiliensis]MBC3515990.1 PH domain-containing protein [Neobittarella massiliensis]